MLISWLDDELLTLILVFFFLEKYAYITYMIYNFPQVLALICFSLCLHDGLELNDKICFYVLFFFFPSQNVSNDIMCRN